tara:strand:+ start:254 stop:976 length:723 start_codon:yes stop_codon:yes gene_type:complete
MVNVDTVYQKVLTLANKEQRGYITPQEFNLLANQAQLDILEQYFYDTNFYGRQPGNDTEYSDMLGIMQEKLSELEIRLPNEVVVNGVYDHRAIGFPNAEVYKLGSVHARMPVELGSQIIEIEEVNNNELMNMILAPLTTPTISRPVYVNRQNGLNIFPSTIIRIDLSYIRKPVPVQWAYVVVNDKPLYNSNISRNFSLHASEESGLVYRILALAGITIKDPELSQAGAQLEGLQIQQEKI